MSEKGFEDYIVEDNRGRSFGEGVIEYIMMYLCKIMGEDIWGRG
jgi:hypothetical protein